MVHAGYFLFYVIMQLVCRNADGKQADGRMWTQMLLAFDNGFGKNPIGSCSRAKKNSPLQNHSDHGDNNKAVAIMLVAQAMMRY